MGKLKRMSAFVALLFSMLMLAQPQCPTCPPGTGGVGGHNPGAVASPIDMYVYVLAIVAILIIVYFAKKYKTQKI